jgi:hypothetical protein
MTAAEDPFSGAVPLRNPPLETVPLRELPLKMIFLRMVTYVNRF